jgi:hypothetical protein
MDTRWTDSLAPGDAVLVRSGYRHHPGRTAAVRLVLDGELGAGEGGR